jgi:5-methylcytosine-specific restriction protein A
MPTMPRVHRALGVPTPMQRYQNDYRRRGTRQQQGYTNEWLRAAADFRRRHPLCAMCLKLGRYTPCQCVDHVIPHRGDAELFWNEDNWQSLCNPCHNGPKRRIEEAARRADCAQTLQSKPSAKTGGSTTETAPSAEARPVANFCAREKARGGFGKS